MPMLTDLATAARKSGLPVTEIDGWRTRGHGPLTTLDTIVAHHTATPRTAPGDYPSLGIVRDGRAGLPGPLSQLGLGRSGRVYVIAAGVAWHAGQTALTRQDNWHALGIEAEHDGVSPWPDQLVDAYAHLTRALLDHYDLPIARLQGHKEIVVPPGRKIDPNFDMDAFRRRVANLTITQEDPMTDYAKQLDQIQTTVDRTERMVRDKLIRTNTRLARANTYLRQVRAALADDASRADLDRAVDELQAAIDEGATS